MPINPRFRARDPNAMSISPFAIGSINFGVSPSGVERSASKNRPNGFRAASNPERTAAPLPRFGKFSSKRVSIVASFNLSRAIAAVASVDPSFTTINSPSAALAVRYSSVRRSVSPIRPASLKQGITAENGGSMRVLNSWSVEPLKRVLFQASLTLQRFNTSTIDFDNKLPVWIDVAAIHSSGIKWQCDTAPMMDRDQSTSDAQG